MTHIKQNGIWIPDETIVKTSGIYTPGGRSVKEKDTWRNTGNLVRDSLFEATLVNNETNTQTAILTIQNFNTEITGTLTVDGEAIPLTFPPTSTTFAIGLNVRSAKTAKLILFGDNVHPMNRGFVSGMSFGSNKILRSIDHIHDTHYGLSYYPRATSSVLVAVPNNLPPSITELNLAFYNCSIFNQSLNDWDTSNIKNMIQTFQSANGFNQPLNKWNTSNVLYMGSMFRNNLGFQQNLTMWNVEKVTTWSNFRTGAVLSTNYTPAKFL